MADMAVYQKACVPRPQQIWPYTWDMIQFSRNKISQIKAHFDIIRYNCCFETNLKDTPRKYIFCKFVALSGFGLFIGPANK
jgi:hypothetical protein